MQYIFFKAYIYLILLKMKQKLGGFNIVYNVSGYILFALKKSIIYCLTTQFNVNIIKFKQDALLKSKNYILR